MNKKLVYFVLGAGVFAVLALIFGEKFLINGIVGAIMAGIMWLFVEHSRLTEKSKQEKTNAQKQTPDNRA